MIKKIIQKMILSLILFSIWYGLRWYFVLPREEYLGSFNYKNLYLIKIYALINYDDILYYYAYSIEDMKNGQLEITKEHFACDYDRLELNDFIFEEQREHCLIKIEYESIKRIDTLLILDDFGKVIDMHNK